MLNPELLKLLRKRWYLVLLLFAVLGGLIFLIMHYGGDAKTLLRDYGYLVVLFWTFLEGETIVIIAGMFSQQFHLNPWIIALCAFGGSFTSDQVMFSLGKYKGHAVLQYFPRLERNIDKAALLFKKYDIALILGFRFVYGIRNVTPILLGISGLNHKKFFALNFIGAAVWALTFTFGGLYSGKAFMSIMEHVGHGLFYSILGIIALGGLLWFIRSRMAVKHVKEIAGKGLEATHPPAAGSDITVGSDSPTADGDLAVKKEPLRDERALQKAAQGDTEQAETETKPQG